MSFNITASAAETNGLATRFENFGIYVATDKMNLTEEYLTRETFAVIISQFCGIDRTSTSYSVTGMYPDVTSERWTAGLIELVGKSGIITSYADGLFRPDAPVTFGTAIKAFINILGYTPIANLKGGWPNGYIEEAYELGLADGINKAYDENITKGEFSEILNSFLVTDMMSVMYNGNDTSKFVINYGKTPLNSKLDIYEHEGVLTATDLTALSGYNKAQKGSVVINGVILDTTKSLHDYIGMYVKAYYKQGEEDLTGTIVDIQAVDKKNKIIELDCKDIASATTVTNLVYNTNKSIKEVKIDPEATLIFNGVSKPIFTEKDLVPLNGTVKLIDSDSDNVYETILVKSYIDFVVANVNNNGTTIYITDKVAGKQVAFDFDTTTITVLKDGKVVNMSDLSKGLVVSIAASDVDTETMTILPTSKNAEIVISGNTAEGVVTGLTGQKTLPVSQDPADGTYKTYETVTIGETEYEISPFYNFTKYPIEMGKSAKVALNTKDEIVMITTESALTYGVIENAAVEGGLDEVLRVKLFTGTGKHVTYDAVKNVVIDGVKYTSGTDALLAIKRGGNLFSSITSINFTSGNATEQLIKYKINEDELITEIDTVVSTTKERSDALKYGVTLEGGYKLGYTVSAASINEDVIGYSGDALIFRVPTDATDKDVYSVSGKAGWTGDTFKNKIILWDMDEYNVAQLIYMPVGEATAPQIDEADEKNVAIVKKVYTALSKDGEEVLTADCMYMDGKEFTFQIKDKTVLRNRTLRMGDMIRWSGDVSNPTALQISVSIIDRVVQANSEKISPLKPYSQYYHSFSCLYGTVESIGDEFMLVRCGEGINEIHVSCRLNDVKAVVEVDSSSTSDRATVGYASISDIKSEANFGAEASRVVVIESYGKPTGIIIYR